MKCWLASRILLPLPLLPLPLPPRPRPNPSSHPHCSRHTRWSYRPKRPPFCVCRFRLTGDPVALWQGKTVWRHSAGRAENVSVTFPGLKFFWKLDTTKKKWTMKRKCCHATWRSRKKFHNELKSIRHTEPWLIDWLIEPFWCISEHSSWREWSIDWLIDLSGIYKNQTILSQHMRSCKNAIFVPEVHGAMESHFPSSVSVQPGKKWPICTEQFAGLAKSPITPPNSAAFLERCQNIPLLPSYHRRRSAKRMSPGSLLDGKWQWFLRIPWSSSPANQSEPSEFWQERCI